MLDFLPKDGEPFDEWTPEAQAIKAAMIKMDTIDLCAMFFPEMEGSVFKVSHHHRVLADTLDKVYSGEIKRLIINIPPGYTKTLMTMIGFMARGFAINPRCRFLHLSTSDGLVRENSSYVQNIIAHPWFQTMFPMAVKKDSKAKNHWKTDAGGELLATSTRGGVIGFRAGRPNHSADNFTGAILVDDPIKPVDAMSETQRSQINALMNNTIRTRLMIEDVPIVMIMQRVHENDPTDYCLSGGTGEQWHWLCMPALNETGRPPPVPDRYEKWAIPVDYTVPTGALWPFKHTVEQLKKIESSRTDEDESSGFYVWNAQYQQTPASIKTGIFKKSWFVTYDALPLGLTKHVIVIDTASKDGEANDWTVMMCAAVGYDEQGRKIVYIIDVLRAKLQLPQLISSTKSFWQKMKTVWVEDQNGADIELSGASSIVIEDKGHGTGLIQQGRQDGLPCVGVARSISKIERAIPCIPVIQQGRVMLPSCSNRNTDALWVKGFLQEIAEFNEMMTHRHDDQADVLFDVIDQLLLSKGEISTSTISGMY